MAFGISFALISIQESNVNTARHGSKGKPKQSLRIFLENQRPRQSAGALPNPGALKTTPPLIPVSPRPVNRRDDLFCVDVFIHRVNEQRSTYKPPTRVHENIFNDRVLLRCLLAIFSSTEATLQNTGLLPFVTLQCHSTKDCTSGQCLFGGRESLRNKSPQPSPKAVSTSVDYASARATTEQSYQICPNR